MFIVYDIMTCTHALDDVHICYADVKTASQKEKERKKHRGKPTQLLATRCLVYVVRCL